MENNCDEQAKFAEREERAKKLYRYVNDVARRVSDATTSCHSISELFTTMIEVQRQKLRDNCEKLLFLDPLNHGKKALELLWRKVYYDTISMAKKLRESDHDFDTYLFTHIVGGIGNFHHFITRIECDMKVQFKAVDYTSLQYDEEFDGNDKVPSESEIQFGLAALHSCLIYLGDLSRYQAEIFHNYDPSIAARYYLQAAHVDMSSGMPYNQLGNLYLDKNYNLDSVCYYIHCLTCVTPFEGATGNLTKIFEKNTQFFENFNETDTLTQTEHIQNTVANFLSLIEIWYFCKDDTNIPQRCGAIAQDLKIALDFNMTPLPDKNKSYEDYHQALEEETITPSYLSGNIIHKIVLICLFTIAKLTEIDEQKAFACKAFTLALLSQLLQKLLKQLEVIGFKNPAQDYHYKKNYNKEHVEEAVEAKSVNGETSPHEQPNDKNTDEIEKVDIQDHSDEVNKKLSNGDLKNGGPKKSLGKRRRRRRIASSESSDMSDADTQSSDMETEETCSDDELSDSSYQSVDSKSDEEDCSDKEDLTEKPKKSCETTQQDVADKKINNNDIDYKPTKNVNDVDGETKLNEEQINNFFLGENILPSIKLLQDWVLTEKDLILSCGDSGESLFQCVVDLLNIFTFYFNTKSSEVQECNTVRFIKKLVKKLKLEYRTIPLPEDVNLRGTNVCKFDKNAAEWQILDRYKPTVYEENVIRILNFIDFGNQVAKIVPKIRFNKTMKIFYLKKAVHPKLTAKINHKKSREWHNSKKQHGDSGESGLLRRLGRLWLASRVRELERAGAGAGASASAPALLALDAAALYDHLRRVKQLVRTRNFILLVPTVVVQELDDLKRDRSGARDAIRWLETQLKSGSRFVRAQRAGQSKPLPLLKYPRKAPPRVHNFIQILEFCNHFIADEKQSQGGNGDPDNSLHGKSAPLLVLLVGEQPSKEEEHFKEFSLTGAAQSAGISVEYICDFYTKWRQTLHKSGKKR